MGPIKKSDTNLHYNLKPQDEIKKIRLFNGLNENEGFLQIFNATLREWTWVCDNQFNRYVGSVDCKELNKEYRNVLINSLFYYTAPWETLPIWNQTFICNDDYSNLDQCETFANYQIHECQRKGNFIYLMCNEYPMAKTEYLESWGGIRFAKPYFETRKTEINTDFLSSQIPIYINKDLYDEKIDESYMNYVQIIGAGKLHGEMSSSVQFTYRSPFINNCNITLSNYHGIEIIQPKSTITLNNLQISESNGYAINTLLLNTQTTDQKSSFKILTENTLSVSDGLYSMIGICDSHKFYDLDQRILLFYKYSNEARDCIKIFRTKISSNNLGKFSFVINFQ